MNLQELVMCYRKQSAAIDQLICENKLTEAKARIELLNTWSSCKFAEPQEVISK